MTQFILYDGRAKLQGDDAASVMCCADSEPEAWDDSETFRDHDAIWFEYDMVDGVAVNGRPRPDIGKWILS